MGLICQILTRKNGLDMTKDEIVTLTYSEYNRWFSSDECRSFDKRELDELERHYWLYHRFCRDRNIIDFYGVDVNENLVCDDVFTWIIENTTGKWCLCGMGRFLFETKQDAVLFKMVWG